MVGLRHPRNLAELCRKARRAARDADLRRCRGIVREGTRGLCRRRDASLQQQCAALARGRHSAAHRRFAARELGRCRPRPEDGEGRRVRRRALVHAVRMGPDLGNLPHRSLRPSGRGGVLGHALGRALRGTPVDHRRGRGLLVVRGDLCRRRHGQPDRRRHEEGLRPPGATAGVAPVPTERHDHGRAGPWPPANWWPP